MVKHFMILSSSYSTGTRIAKHYVISDGINPEMLTEEVRTIKKNCGETVSISTHFVETDSETWDSVVEKDPFFAGVHVVDTTLGFVNYISEDRKLKGVDIAKYILSVKKCTHLQLEKLVYMCYAEYLCATGKRLFEDYIYAFKYGPVVKSVYDEYKGYKEIDDVSSDRDISIETGKMPARSRILFAEDGASKIVYIDATLEKYGGYTASELVTFTHVPGGPWDSVNKDELYTEIPDKIILERHYKECV